MTTKIDYKSLLTKLVDVCKDEFDYKVSFSKKYGNEVSFSKKEIKISSSQIDEHALYSCFHEIGHIILFKNKNYNKKYNLKIDTSLSDEEDEKIHKKASKKLSYRISILKEELDAWEEGKIFALEKGFPINEKKWRALMCSCIKAYANFVVNPSNTY